MKKQQAIEAFGSVAALATALGISPQAIYKWPDVLPQRTADEVVGAAIRVNHGAPADEKRQSIARIVEANNGGPLEVDPDTPDKTRRRPRRKAA